MPHPLINLPLPLPSLCLNLPHPAEFCEHWGSFLLEQRKPDFKVLILRWLCLRILLERKSCRETKTQVQTTRAFLNRNRLIASASFISTSSTSRLSTSVESAACAKSPPRFPQSLPRRLLLPALLASPLNLWKYRCGQNRPPCTSMVYKTDPQPCLLLFCPRPSAAALRAAAHRAAGQQPFLPPGPKKKKPPALPHPHFWAQLRHSPTLLLPQPEPQVPSPHPRLRVRALRGPRACEGFGLPPSPKRARNYSRNYVHRRDEDVRPCPAIFAQ